MTETEQSTNGSGASGDAAAAKVDLTPQILRQVEFYFGDFNLPKDKFMQEQLKLDDGWVPMETMLKFKRLANLSDQASVILAALKDSELMEVDEEKQRIRRSPAIPLPEWSDERKKELSKQTVYCKGLDKEKTTHDDLLLFFDTFDGVKNVQMRTYVNRKDNTRGFKGSVFVTFKERESAEKFMALEKVTYRDVDLLRKWQEDYFEEKKNEAMSLRKERQDKKKKLKDVKDASAAAEEGDDKNDKNGDEGLPKGAILLITGLNKETTREDIKEKLNEEFSVAPETIAFVFYQKGETEAKLRFKEENAAKDLMTKIPEEGFEVKGTKVSAKALEGEEEDAFLKQCSTDIKERMSRKRTFHKKRGGFRGGRGAKRQKF